MTEPEVMDHAFHRSMERLGVPKRSVRTLAAKAYAEGHRQHEYTGKFARFLGDMGRYYKTTPVIYHQNIFVFDHETLVTVYMVPREFRNHKAKVKS